jgi:tetratricopeptide (TPR) repeat protein
MKILGVFFSLLLLTGALGCTTSYQVGGELQPGRYALRRGDPKMALVHFQRAAEIDPNYTTDFTALKQGVYTYIGRAHYNAGNFPEALKALERANSLHNDDYLADLYLGLVFARQGNEQAGRKAIETGLSGLNNWFEYVIQYHPDGNYWDPGGVVRQRIQNDLAMLGGREANWTEIIASTERIGDAMEDEIELAPRRWYKDQRNSDGRDDGGRN